MAKFRSYFLTFSSPQALLEARKEEHEAVRERLRGADSPLGAAVPCPE